MLAIAALVAAVAVVAVVLLRGSGDDYVVNAEFENASQLVKGNEVAGRRRRDRHASRTSS